MEGWKIFGNVVFLLCSAVAISIIGLAADGSFQRSMSDGARLIFLAVYIMVGYNSAKWNLSEADIVRVVIAFAVISVFVFRVCLYRAYWFVDLFKGRLSNIELPFHF